MTFETPAHPLDGRQYPEATLATGKKVLDENDTCVHSNSDGDIVLRKKWRRGSGVGGKYSYEKTKQKQTNERAIGDCILAKIC